ncbi:MAG TPA: phosphatidate cytidylyltransferase [Gemmatimonadaceae bacterium]|nr:phosphatidate cytidylyltransferase [Gemmatimonadaceae bacterium]
MGRSELARRVLVAVVAIPVVVIAVYAGGAALAALLAIAAALAAGEFFRLARSAGYEPIAAIGVPVAAILPLLMHATHLGLAAPRVTWGVLVVLVVFVAALRRGPTRKPLAATAVTIVGMIYTGGLLSYGYMLRYDEYAIGAAAGSALVLYPLVLTWLSDTAAYFVGRAIGRRKLMPLVSPGKTVEGAVAALIASMIVSWLYVHYVLTPLSQLSMSTIEVLLFGLIVGIAEQLGDLVESLFKREAGVKDSSHLLPGHGGVLDRVDSLLFALPVAYWLMSLPHVFSPALR